MENKSTTDHKTKFDIMLKQDIVVESEKPVVDIKYTDDNFSGDGIDDKEYIKDCRHG